MHEWHNCNICIISQLLLYVKCLTVPGSDHPEYTIKRKNTYRKSRLYQSPFVLVFPHLLYVRACVMRLESIWIRGGVREEEREHQTLWFPRWSFCFSWVIIKENGNTNNVAIIQSKYSLICHIDLSPKFSIKTKKGQSSISWRSHWVVDLFSNSARSLRNLFKIS